MKFRAAIMFEDDTGRRTFMAFDSVIQLQVENEIMELESSTSPWAEFLPTGVRTVTIKGPARTVEGFGPNGEIIELPPRLEGG